jgi:lipopolysaccharide transport system ATP-binding protein
VSVGSSPAVRADGLGKRYEIGLRPWSGALYDRIGRLLRPSARRANGELSTLWALREVSFEVPHGHVLGVLGRNGSGKTTLMKILARVTAPTEGTALTYGRVGALLQVGTGFHPELSGRDNIALSGAILGMSRAEVAARTEQIIDFAEIGRFLDTPVKHYSSGMYLRLAFSVSAHLAADVLLIDEVLAVGDAAFQKKCRERIRSSVAEGRTVLFVSHQMASVKELCDSAMVLDQGRMIFMGDTQQAVKTYDSEVGGRH